MISSTIFVFESLMLVLYIFVAKFRCFHIYFLRIDMRNNMK